MTEKRSLCSNVAVLAFITCATFATTSSATADETLIRPGHNLYEDAPTDAVVASGERISPLSFRESGGKVAHENRLAWRRDKTQQGLVGQSDKGN